MPQTYTHLTQEQRYTISARLQSGHRLGQIAKDLGISRQTLWRERKRNTGKSGYRPLQAHKLASKRRACKAQQINAFGHAFVAHLIKRKWSPEQISRSLSAQGWEHVPSPEWIYRFVYSEQGQALSLRADLRCQKKYRKRGYQTQDRRGKISDRTSIHLREFAADNRSRLGDLEGDTMIGAHHKGALLTLVDRKSLHLWVAPLAHRYAHSTADACISVLASVKAHTITFDNGKEFAQHRRIAQHTRTSIYFADPYQSNQRARNENTNGLIRQYTPKGIPLDKLDALFVQNMTIELNARPRKTLNWLTPAQVWAQNPFVALHS